MSKPLHLPIALAMSLAAAFSAQAAPKLDVLVTPQATQNVLTRMNVNMKLEAPKLDAGKVLLRAPLVLFGIPMAGIGASDIVASDDAGALELKAEEEPPTSSGAFRRWLTTRATVGDVKVAYGTAPRQVDASTRNGPLLDLRSEAGGVNGAGAYFMAVPPGPEKRDVNLHWDMSKVPAGWRAVWSLGEGDQQKSISAETLAYSYYMVGPLKASTSDKNAKFGVYWLSEPPFKLDATVRELSGLYEYMSTFFRDKNSTYRIFARANPYPAGGGTALANSFLFGYGSGGQAAGSGSMTLLLAHEMTHNWPILNLSDDPAIHGWYNEGAAEYYSGLLLLRSGNISLKEFEEFVNERAANYVTNPFRDYKFEDAIKVYWKDARAQRVPYGRGFMYLAKVDAQIRAKSGGKRSLDDIVLELVDRRLKEKNPVAKDWLELVVQELGEGARQDYQDMLDGKLVVPPKNTFAPCLEMVETTTRGFELGFDEMSLGVVKNPRPGTAADKAGLKDGDKIVKFTPLKEVREDATKNMDIVVEREGKQLEFTYLPRGEALPAVKWQRANGAKPECKV